MPVTRGLGSSKWINFDMNVEEVKINKSRQPRALVFSVDDNFVMPFQVLFYSLHVTNSIPGGTPIFILYLEGDLSGDSRETLQGFLEHYNQEAVFVDTKEKLPDDLPISEDAHVSRATFYRLFVASILPKSVSSALYLDLDTVVVKSIRDLFDVELKSPVAAVDHLSPENTLRLRGWSGGNYFQAGVLLIDLDYWRENNCEATFVDIMKKQRPKIRFWDQDVLNIAFAENWQRLDIWFNVSQAVIATLPEDVVEENMRLLHYDGNHKPWKNGVERSFKEVWSDAYADLFGERFERPKSSCRKLCGFVLSQLKSIRHR